MSPSSRLVLAATLLAAVAVTWLVPEIRWRVQVIGLKAAGQIDAISYPQLFRLLAPGSPVYLEGLVSSRNPYSVITNPLTGPEHSAAGGKLFASRCAGCHGEKGTGGTGPSLVAGNLRNGDSDWAIYRVIERGLPGTAMRAQGLTDVETWSTIGHIRELQAAGSATTARPRVPALANVTTARLVASRDEPENWLTYSGTYDGARHSALDEINRDNASQVRISWIHQFSGTGRVVETSPIVNGGVMYVTEPPSIVHAIDPATGATFWTYTHRNADDVVNSVGLVNRGVAIHEDTVYLGTPDVHLIALDAATGRERWKVRLDDYRKGLSITGAPLVVGDKVIVGYGGGEFGIRGFLDAVSVRDGSKLWRFYTVPGPGEPGHDTWSGDSWQQGGAPTWLTGVYDPALKLLYWATGNPGPDYQGDARQGDNLYSNSVVALDPDTGKLRWHFQFTPHDERDWDANQVPTLTDLTIGGRERKVMLWPNRNAFFYVLDRVTGEFLLAKPFAKQNWAKGIDARGRPILNPDVTVDTIGRLTYPGPVGAMNWQSPSYSPRTGLLYVPALESGRIIYRDAEPVRYSRGRDFRGGGHQPLPGAESLYFSVRAIEPATGNIVWSYDNPRRLDWLRTGGLVSTAGDIVFGGDGTELFILDATSGRELWRQNVGGRINAPAVTYRANGRQLFAIAAGRSIIAVGLP